jgi:hypothetical protein
MALASQNNPLGAYGSDINAVAIRRDAHNKTLAPCGHNTKGSVVMSDAHN